MTFTKEVFPDALCTVPTSNCRICGSVSGDKYLQPNDGDVRSLREEQSAFQTFGKPMAIIRWIRGQTYPENHWNREVYQGIVLMRRRSVESVVSGGARSRSLRHMLPPSLRLLVRHRARSVPLQLQRCLNSTDTRPNGFADFAGWAQNLHGVHRVKQSHSDSGGAQRDGPSKKKKKKTPGSKPPHSTRKNPSSAMTRERRIIKTILGTSRYGWKPPPTIKNARDLPTEDWGADDWGLDSESRVLNLGTIQRTDHNVPGQNSNLHPQIEVSSLGLRNPGV